METKGLDSSVSTVEEEGDRISEKSGSISQSHSLSSPRLLVTPEQLDPPNLCSSVENVSDSNWSIVKNKKIGGTVPLQRASTSTSLLSLNTPKKTVKVRPWSSTSLRNKVHKLAIKNEGKLQINEEGLSPQSASWSFTGEKKFATKWGTSRRTSPSTRLSPILSANVCVERSFRFGSSQCISPEGELRSCFPDKKIRIFVLTWNMQEMKVRNQSCFFLITKLIMKL